MKIALASDLHLEFGDIDLVNQEGADVLILAGDIMVAKRLREDPHGYIESAHNIRYRNFVERFSNEFPHVVMVAGNHEHYDGDYAKTLSVMKNAFKHHSNVHILDKEHVTIDGVTFFGGTLWTDMNKEDEETLYSIRKRMSDFRCVSNSLNEVHYKVPVYPTKPDHVSDEDWANGIERHVAIGTKFNTRIAAFSPEDSVQDHKAFLAALDKCYSSFDKMVVVGHHAPSIQSIHDLYISQTVMNGAYFSNLEKFIEDRPNIKMWVHGHVHNPFEYKIGSTQIACNPRGYIGHEAVADDFMLKYYEV